MTASGALSTTPAPEASERGASVELRGVRFAHGTDFAIEVDRLALAPGERAACIGPSGTGKTTLVNLIAGILVPAAGRVSLDGRELSALPDPERRALRLASIGMVFQELALLHYLTARDNVLLPYHVSMGHASKGRAALGVEALELTAGVRERAEHLAAACGIAHVLDRTPDRLSQGERQRVALCRAMVTEPRLVLCDEPTGNLDPRTAAATLDLLLERVEASGATLFMVTHDHGVLERFGRVVDVTDLHAAPRPAEDPEP